MNPDRIRAAIRMLYPAEMTPTARNVLENILDDEELEAVVNGHLPCEMIPVANYNFAYCETHDQTFKLNEVCAYKPVGGAE